MKIAILDDYQDCIRNLSCYQMLEGHDVKVFTSSARGLIQLALRLAEFEVLVLNRERTTVSAALLQRLPKLKLICQAGTLGPHIDLDAACARGVTVTEGRSDPTAPAELTWALIMASMRKVPQYAANLREGRWQTASINPELNTLGRSVKGRTLAIWGYGRIGRIVAGYGRAFGMRVLVWGGTDSLAAAVADGLEAADSKQALFDRADVLSLHLHMSERSRGVVCADDLARMQRDALFVNISHAALVEPGALEAALHLGHPGFAALDVFEGEPLPPDAPLLRIPTVLATPHIGYVERDSYEHLFEAAFHNVLAFANGQSSG